MIYKSSKGDLDLSKIVRLYPAVVVDMHGEVAEMSLEWEELYGSKVKIVHYVLVFDFTPAGVELKEKTVLTFTTKEALIQEMSEVAKYLQ